MIALIFLISFLIFFKSLFVFYTNDDFFFLHISNIKNFGEFVNFFNIIKGPEGFGMYRPLATQVFYFLSWKLFNLNPIGLHIISFTVFFGVIYLVYKLILELLKDEKIALISAFLYGVSATHFGHLYYLATFQELLMTLFVLLSCLFFLRNRKVLSFIFFILGLMSKETAVITPILFVLIYWFQKVRGESVQTLKKFLVFFTPFAICLFAYLLIRVHWYGFATGDTYVWDFSIRKLINTVFWYLLWSLNLPETLLDFVGPGLKLNPELFVYWSKEFIPIFILFFLECIVLIYILTLSLLRRTVKFIRERDEFSIFAIGWFLITLAPVVFLPLHKFTFYLTLPLIAVTSRIAYLLVKTRTRGLVVVFFLIVWTALCVLTIKHTVNTHWVTQGEGASRRTYDFLNKNMASVNGRDIVFADTIYDKSLPWSPTATVKSALSDQNFFKVFYPDFMQKVYYGAAKDTNEKNSFIIISRTLLGY